MGAAFSGLSCSTSWGSSPFLRPENIVHQTMNKKINPAPSASSNNNVMSSNRLWKVRLVRIATVAFIVGMLGGCAVKPLPPPHSDQSPHTLPEVPAPLVVPGVTVVLSDMHNPPLMDANHPSWHAALAQPLAAPMRQAKSRWQPVRWTDVPGWGQDPLHDLWNAWLRSCERPAEGWATACQELRQHSLSSEVDRYAWLMQRFQAFRVVPLQGQTPGLLTGYYEPIMQASRTAQGPYQHPLYAVPSGLRNGQTWFTREQMDTHPPAQAQLAGRAIAWLADPLDALILQIQGSGRLLVQEPDGQQRMVRLAFAAHNSQPYQSVGRWLLDRRLIQAGTWEAIREWAAVNPHRLNEMLWSNPRMVFFSEESLDEMQAQFGPRGAQGVPLTPGRSIAVDRQSIPYGTPVWMLSPGPHAHIRRLVIAQDTGGAIVGPVRADFFAGWGDDAYTLAAGIRQHLALWVLWPKP